MEAFGWKRKIQREKYKHKIWNHELRHKKPNSVMSYIYDFRRVTYYVSENQFVQ